MSRVYKLYLPTYIPHPSDFARRLFFEPEATRATRSIVLSHPIPLPVGPPPPFPLAATTPQRPIDPPRHSSRACVRALPRVCVRACLTIRVFVSAMNALLLTVNLLRALQGEEKRMARLSPCKINNFAEFFYPDQGRSLANDLHLPRTTKMCKIPSVNFYR